MREPKPFVVGISWVVECVEQCRRVGEENFLVDLEGLNVAGNNKVSFPWDYRGSFGFVLISLPRAASAFDVPEAHLVKYASTSTSS